MPYKNKGVLIDFRVFERLVKEAEYVEWDYDIVTHSRGYRNEAYNDFIERLKEEEAYKELAQIQDNKGLPPLYYDRETELFDELLYNVRHHHIILKNTKVAVQIQPNDDIRWFYGCGDWIALLEVYQTEGEG